MKSRWLALGLALVGAAVLALSSLEAWWVAGEVAIGPFGSHHCFGGDCQSGGLAWLGGSDLWMRAAVATRAAALIGTALLVILAGALAARRVPRLVGRTTIVALSAATITGGYFLAKFPPLGGEHVALGPVLYAAGIVLGAVAAVLVLRTRVDPPVPGSRG
jgi:hypothetical protein